MVESAQEDIGIAVGGVDSGAVRLTYSQQAEGCRATITKLQVDLPPQDKGWTDVLGAIEGHAKSRGAVTVGISSSPDYVGAFHAAGFRTTMMAFSIPSTDVFQELPSDDRMAVRFMDKAERQQFIAEVGEVLDGGMQRAGVLAAETDREKLEAALTEMARDSSGTAKDEHLLVVGELNGLPVGRLWATRIVEGEHVDLSFQTVDIFPEHRGRRLLPFFYSALIPLIREVGAQNCRFRLYGDDQRAQDFVLSRSARLLDVRLRKDIG